jgi:hypothetical protein
MGQVTLKNGHVHAPSRHVGAIERGPTGNVPARCSPGTGIKQFRLAPRAFIRVVRLVMPAMRRMVPVSHAQLAITATKAMIRHAVSIANV